MSKKICHLLIVFGNENQTYTTGLLELLNKNSDENHYVFCHSVLKSSNKIKIYHTRQYGYLHFLFLFIKYFISDKDFRYLNETLSFKDLYKWMALFEVLPDILHLHHAHAITIPILKYLKQKKVKLIISLRGRDLLVNTQNKDELEKLKLKLSFADKTHNISNYMQQYLKEMLAVDSEVVYRGQELADISNTKTRQIKTNEISVIAVGRLEWEKGHIYLIESIYRLRERGFNIKLDIYGNGQLEENLIYRIKQLGLQDIIRLMGHIDNDLLKKKYKNYNIAVQPSLTEALSNGLVDFMMHNLPCVITNVGGMVEVIEDNINGIIVDKKDLKSLDDAIIKTLSLDFATLKMFNQTHQDKFTRSAELKGFFEMYKSL